ncbi:hypothetical protein [Pseudomonas segetis]|uniref:Carboxypeptidase regulatory-like domain-containing protein n=1 Tax=Pseudomonas segetis TaxID=298908 RepID=A0A239J1Y1_9PSED|nr:hypothetical protein [Pseudomonas segetis]SNS98664.1 hypothetical protein SAMN05216255_4092 [Pseudomonas segetis]
MKLSSTPLLLACMGSVIAGCTTLPSPEYTVTNDEKFNLQNAGIIVGSIDDAAYAGADIQFRDTSSGSTYTITDANASEFSMWLPAGTYSVSAIGPSKAWLGTYSRPLTFSVSNGAINYIGDLSYGCVQQSPNLAWYGQRYCGIGSLPEQCTTAHPLTSMCIIDNQQQAVNAFKDRFSQFADTPQMSALMTSSE